MSGINAPNNPKWNPADNTLPTTAELITMLSEFNCHADVQKLASDRLEALETHITALEAERVKLLKYVEHKDMCGLIQSSWSRPCTCGLNELLSKQEQEQQ